MSLEEGQRLEPGAAHPGASGRRRPPRVRSRSVEQPTGNVATEGSMKTLAGRLGAALSKNPFAAFGGAAP